MKREGRQHGMVRISTSYLPPEFNPKPNAANKVINPLGSPPTAGVYTKVPAKPTGHSKFTGKCRKARCRSCHAAPVTKSKDKAKGAYKLRSGDVVLNHLLSSWRVVDNGGLAGSPTGFRGFSASEILGQLSASYQWHEGDDHGEEEYIELHDGYSDQFMGDQEEEYCSADDLVAKYAAAGVEEEEEEDEELEEAGTSGGGGDDSEEEEGGGEEDLDFFVVGVVWEYSDGEDWLVVEEM